MKRFSMKRITALVLALVMTLSLLPMNVWATEGEAAMTAEHYIETYLMVDSSEGKGWFISPNHPELNSFAKLMAYLSACQQLSGEDIEEIYRIVGEADEADESNNLTDEFDNLTTAINFVRGWLTIEEEGTGTPVEFITLINVGTEGEDYYNRVVDSADQGEFNYSVLNDEMKDIVDVMLQWEDAATTYAGLLAKAQELKTAEGGTNPEYQQLYMQKENYVTEHIIRASDLNGGIDHLNLFIGDGETKIQIDSSYTLDYPANFGTFEFEKGSNTVLWNTTTATVETGYIQVSKGENVYRLNISLILDNIGGDSIIEGPFAGFTGDAKKFIDEYLEYDINVTVWIRGANLWVEPDATTYQYLGINSWNAAKDCLEAYDKLGDKEKADIGSVEFPSGTVSYILGVYREILGNPIKYFYSFDEITEFAGANDAAAAAAVAWLGEYINYTYNGTIGEFWFKDAGAMKNGYPVNEKTYTAIKKACLAYKDLLDKADGTDFWIDLLYLSEGTIGGLVRECISIVHLPYYTLLAGVTDEDAIEFIETYVTCRAYEDWYMTMLAGAWQWSDEEQRDVYNPTAAKVALDAYEALSDTAKKALEGQYVKQGDPYNPNDYWTPTFAEWMQKQQTDYLFQTNPDAGTLLDPKAMIDVSARDFFEDYFEYEVSYDHYFGCDVLNFWMNVPTAPDGGYLTQEGYDQAERMLNAYNALSEDAKKELDKLLVDGSRNESFSWRLMQRYGSLRMAAPTGTASPDSLSQAAWDLLAEVGLTLTDVGELSITGVKMVYVDGEYQYWIDYSQENKDDGLANMNKVAPVLENWFGFNFNNNLPYPPMNQRNWNIFNELNQLKITVNGEEMWFDKAMEYFLQIWERMQHNGYYTDYIFQTVGYTSLPLGTAETKVTDPGFENGFFYVEVADGLILGEDYAYEYTYKGTTYIYDDAEATAPKTVENADPSLEGVLTVYAYAGEKEHWGEAAGNTHKVMANAGVLFHVYFVGPANADRHAGICGNGFDGVFTKYLRHNEVAYAQQLYDSCYLGTNSGNGRPMASINQVGDVVTVTANDHYGSDHQLVAWFNGEVIVGLNMLRYRVIADDFSYEFNKPVEKTEATAVTFNDATKWETIKNVLGELIVRPTNGTIKETLASETNTPYNAFGCFTLIPPKTGYTLDTNESNALTQDGMVWVKSVDSTTNAVTLNLYAADYDGGRDSAVFYTFVWKNSVGDIIEEELTVRVKERQSFFAEMKKGDIVAQPMSRADATVTPPIGVTTTYDEATGYLEVDFDESNLPSLEVVKALYNRAGVRMTPPEDAMYFRFTMGDGNEDLAYIHTSRANELVVGLEEAKIKPLYRSSGSMSPDAQYELVFPYAAIDPMVLGELTIYFAYTQNYRWQVVEWLDANKSTIGYTYIYGKNGALVQTETTASVSDEEDLPVNEGGQLEQPIIIGEGMNLVANRYIQEGGGGKHWYLRLSVDEESNLDEVNGNWVYLPYSYVDLTWETAKVLKQAGQTPVIYHYEQGENMPPTKIVGEYAPQGIKFNVKSFSPFVVEVSGMEAPEYTVPANLTATYGQTLADVTLPEATNGTWSWKVTDMTSVGNVGDNQFTLVFTPNDTENYVTVEETVTITVSAATPSVTAPEAKNSVIYGNKLSAVGLTDGWTWLDGDAVPTVQNSGYVAYFTPADTSNYDWKTVDGWNAEKGVVERTVAVTVTKQQVTKPDEVTKTFTYTGEEQTYSVVGSNLYTVSGNTRKDAGSQTVTITLNNTANYEWADGTTDAVEYPFTIAKAAVTVTADDKSKTYGASDPEFTYSTTGLKGTDALSNVSVTRASGENVGEYVITATQTAGANSNYEITFVNGTFTITAKTSAPTIELSAETVTYDGTAKEPVVTVKDGERVIPTSEYTVAYSNNTAAGTATVTVTDIAGGNYVVSGTKTFTIVKAQVPKPVADSKAFTYTGSEQTYAVATNDAYTVSGNTRTDAGSQAVTVALKDKANYEWTDKTTADVTFTFTVAKAMQVAPDVIGVNETIFGKHDGKITGVTKTMEYSTNGEDYTAIADGKLENLIPGTYYVRYEENSNFVVSEATVVTIAEGKKITVTFNTNGAVEIAPAGDLSYGDKVTKPSEPKKDNAIFAGWFTDESCTTAWDFETDTVTGDMTLYVKWSDVPVYHISGKVFEQAGNSGNTANSVLGANVKLMLGTTLVAEQITDENGAFYFGGQVEGDYNLVVTYRHNNAKHDKVVTMLVELHKDADDIIVTLPKDVTNSKVEHKSDDGNNAGENEAGVASGTLVGGLDAVAEAMRKAEEDKVTDTSTDPSEVIAKVEVTLTVEDTPPVTNPTNEKEEIVQEQQEAIQEKAPGKQLIFFDLSVMMSVTDDDDSTTVTPITDTGSLLEIRIPFEQGNKRNIAIYRYHDGTDNGALDGSAEILAAVSEGSTTEGFWVGDDGYIHIYTRKFSTYAVGYTEPAPGGYYPVVTPDKDTVEKPEDTKPSTPTTPTTPPAEEVVTPAPEDTTPDVVPDEPPVIDDGAVDEAPSDDAAQSGGAGLWIGIGLAALAAAVVVLIIMATRKKRREQ